MYRSIEILCLFNLLSYGHFLQKHILSLDGPVVTAVGCKDRLAVVTHVSDCLPSNEQVGISFIQAHAGIILSYNIFQDDGI